MSGKKNAMKISGSENVAKKLRRSITLEDKMGVIRRIEGGETRPKVCRSMNLPPSTVTTIMKNADKIKQSMQQATTVSSTKVSYTRSKLIEKMEKLLSLWVDDMRRKNIALTQTAITDKAKSIFEELKKNEGSNEIFLGSKGWLMRFKARTKCHSVKISGEAASTKADAAYPSGFQAIVEEAGMRNSAITQKDLKARHRTMVKSDDSKGNVTAGTEERSSENNEYLADIEVDSEEEDSVILMNVEPVRRSSRNQARLPKLQPRPAGISQDQSPSHSNLSPQHSHLSSKNSYPSHPPALSGPSTLPNQSTFDDSQLSMFLAETRMQNAELRMAMGRLTDKVDGILSKFDRFSQYQSQQQLQKLRAKHAEFEEEKDGWEENEDKELTISKSKLMARIIAMEEKLEIMEKENISLKKDLEDTTSKLVSLQDNQPIEISDAVNSALNSVYSDLEPKFSNGVDYEGLTIRKTIAATIIAVTHQFLDSNIGEKTDSDSCIRRKMEEVPSVQIKTSKQKLKGIPGGDLKKLSQKGYSSEIDVVASSSTTRHVDEEMNAENPDIAHRESLEHTHRKPFDLSESTATLQYDDELIVKEENCSDASSREGSMEMVISMEPLSPPIFDAGEMSESGEEWLPD